MELFVSSTNMDLRAYRMAVRDNIARMQTVRANLNEDWVVEHDWSKEECKRRIQCSQGYLGIFAYYYGWIPNGEDKSITHLEYDWACTKWQRRRRVAIFIPGYRPGYPRTGPCPAEDELQQAAEGLLNGYPLDRQAHQIKLNAFLDAVKRSGRGVNFFEDKAALVGQAMVLAQRWGGGLEAAADAGLQPNTPPQRLTPAQLGRLGRRQQTDAAHEVLAIAGADPSTPGVAMLAYGKETAGHRQFLEWLACTTPFRNGRAPRIGRPEVAPYDLDDLLAWAARETAVGETSDEPVIDLPSLARAMHRVLHRQPMVLMLTSVDYLVLGH